MEPDEVAMRVDVMDGVLGLPAVEGCDAVMSPAIASDVAFADFYRLERDRVARALALALCDVHLGAEAADEAMVRAYQRWDRLSAYEDPSAWAYRVGLNWATSVLRRRRGAPVSVPDQPLEVAAVSEPAVAAALAELSVPQRSVLVCRYYLDMSEAETAAALNIRAGTVKSRLHRGLHQLERRLGHLRHEEQQ